MKPFNPTGTTDKKASTENSNTTLSTTANSNNIQQSNRPLSSTVIEVAPIPAHTQQLKTYKEIKQKLMQQQTAQKEKQTQLLGLQT